MSGFRSLVNEQMSRVEGGARTDLLLKYGCLIAFDCEAAARLGSWTSFEELIDVLGALDHHGLALIANRRLNFVKIPKYTVF